jgi:hypothetical protein
MYYVFSSFFDLCITFFQKKAPAYGLRLRLVRPPCVERAGLKRCVRVDINNRLVFCAKKRNFHRS